MIPQRSADFVISQRRNSGLWIVWWYKCLVFGGCGIVLKTSQTSICRRHLSFNENWKRLIVNEFYSLLTDWLQVNLDDVSMVSAKLLKLWKSHSCSGVSGSRRQSWGSLRAQLQVTAPLDLHRSDRLQQHAQRLLRSFLLRNAGQKHTERADRNDSVQGQRWITTCSSLLGICSVNSVDRKFSWTRNQSPAGGDVRCREKSFGAFFCYCTSQPHRDTQRGDFVLKIFWTTYIWSG